MEESPPRRRSAAVAIPAVTILAASLLASCGRMSAERKACVDASGRVIDERACRTPGGGGRYYYYRGATRGFGSSVGNDGGSYTRGSARSASKGKSSSTKSVGRGGFGGSKSSGS